LSALDLTALVLRLAAEEVDYVVVGGVAVGVHGYVRMTLDLDFVPDPSRRNIERLVAALSRLGGTLPAAAGRRFDPATDAGALRRGANVSLDTPLGGVDVVQRMPGVPPHAELAAAAERVTLDGVSLLVCSLRHLREMKAAAGRPQDKADLAALPES
jgi:hypothetical protein